MKFFCTMSLLLLASLFCAAQDLTQIKITLSSTTWKPGTPVTISWSSSKKTELINLNVWSESTVAIISLKTNQKSSGSLRYTPSEALCGTVNVGAYSKTAVGLVGAKMGSDVKISKVDITGYPAYNPRPNYECEITFYASVFNSCDNGTWEYKIGSSSWKKPHYESDNFDGTGPQAPTKKSFKVRGLGYVPNITGSTTLTIRVKLGSKYFTGKPLPIQIALLAKPEEGSEIPELAAASNIASLKGENIKPNTSFLMYPNPSDSQVNISINSSDERDYTLLIKDLYGRTILSQVDKLFVGSNALSLNVAGLSPGMYILSMLDKSGLLLESQKLQIVR